MSFTCSLTSFKPKKHQLENNTTTIRKIYNSKIRKNSTTIRKNSTTIRKFKIQKIDN
jgi:hypothetical protein